MAGPFASNATEPESRGRQDFLLGGIDRPECPSIDTTPLPWLTLPNTWKNRVHIINMHVMDLHKKWCISPRARVPSLSSPKANTTGQTHTRAQRQNNIQERKLRSIPPASLLASRKRLVVCRRTSDGISTAVLANLLFVCLFGVEGREKNIPYPYGIERVIHRSRLLPPGNWRTKVELGRGLFGFAEGDVRRPDGLGFGVVV